MEEQDQESNFGFGLFDDFPEDELHPLLDEFESVAVGQRTAVNIYQPLKDGTQLHRAIRKGEQTEIDRLLAAYQADYEKLKNYLKTNYRWSEDDKIWLRKFNMIAVGEDQCRICKELERKSERVGDLEHAVFVVFQTLIDGEEVAVIHPSVENRLEVCRIVRQLLPNGLLSWNYTGGRREYYQKGESFMELAASIGRVGIISQLYGLGADLCFADHNPLLAACSTLRKDTIRWLLTEHFNDFDCTQRNSQNMNAFLVLMQRQDMEILDFVLKKMISYRQKYYNESESEAFERIFHYENEELSSLSSLSHLRNGSLREKIAEYIKQYKLDLSHQWRDVTIIVCLMCRNIAVDYCWSEIRKNPNLLGMIVYGETRVLHEFIRLGKLDGLAEIYQLYPDVKQFFENERGIGLLREMCYSKQRDAVLFILENHAEYLLNNLDSVRENVALCSYNSSEFYEFNGDLLAEHFPTLAAEIVEARNMEPSLYPGCDLLPAFHKFNLDFNESSIQTKDPSLLLGTIRGTKGLTLLHYAVDKDNKAWVLDLLDSDCDLDATDDDGNLPVHYVRSKEMFDLIIEKHPAGSSLVHRTNADGYTVLHKVCSLRMDQKLLIALLERVIECGADVNQLTKNNESAVFMIAGCTGLEILLKHNVDLEIVNRAGDNALDCHLRSRNVCMGNALLQLMHKLPSFKDHAHKYVDCFLFSNRDFFSCDYQPFLEQNPETTKIIFDSLFEHSREEASRLFCKASGSAHIFITEKFLEFDYDLDYDYSDDYNYTPMIGLCCYMEQSNVHLMRQLLKKGINLERRNHWGRTAFLELTSRFRSAKWYGHDLNSVQLLLDHGAQINSADNDGNTALHNAFSSDEWELVEFLIANGADLAVTNKQHKTPLEMTSLMNRELFKFLQ